MYSIKKIGITCGTIAILLCIFYLWSESEGNGLVFFNRTNTSLQVKIRLIDKPKPEISRENKNIGPENQADRPDVRSFSIPKEWTRTFALQPQKLITVLYWQLTINGKWYMLPIDMDKQPAPGAEFHIFTDGQFSSTFAGTGKVQEYNGPIDNESDRSSMM